MAKDIFENLGDVMDFAPHVLIASCIVSIITLVTVAAFYRALILPLEPGTKLKLDDPEKGVYKGDKKGRSSDTLTSCCYAGAA